MSAARPLRGLVIALFVAVAVAVWAGQALAHPLGNFTVNRYAGLLASGERVYLGYVLDLAEIPTFQARDEARDGDAYARRLVDEIRGGIKLTIGGEQLTLSAREHRISFPEGSGGLATTRLEVVFETPPLPAGAQQLVYEDTTFPGKIGWKEVTLAAADGAAVDGSSVPAETVSDALRSYPDDLLASPLDVVTASAQLQPGEGPGRAPVLDGAEPATGDRFASPAQHGFEKLVGGRELSTGFVLVAIFVAMFWGAAHALSPGHGKGVVAAYLVGTRGTPRHAVYLGVIVTITHTLGVFALGLVTLALSEFIVPEQLFPWLNLVSAVLVMAVGVAVLRGRLSRWLGIGRGAGDGGTHGHGHGHAHADHDHEHDHDHGDPDHDDAVLLGRRRVRLRVGGHGHHDDGGHHHDHHHHGSAGHHHGAHGHSHMPEPGSGWRGILGVGVASGIVPCPTALVVLLAAISLQRVGFGLLLIVAFSVGLAATMTGIGLLAVWGKGLFARTRFDGRLLRALPALSALAIVGLGVTMMLRAIPDLV